MRQHLYIFGLTLTLLVGQTNTAVAADSLDVTVASVEGQVRVLAADGKAEPAKAGTKLGLGSSLQTAPASSAILKTSDGAVMSLGESSTYTVTEAVPIRWGWGDWTFDLLEGSVRALVKKAPYSNKIRFRIRTISATVGVRGTEFIVFASGDKARVINISGSVWVARTAADLNHANARVLLESSQIVRVAGNSTTTSLAAATVNTVELEKIIQEAKKLAALQAIPENLKDQVPKLSAEEQKELSQLSKADQEQTFKQAEEKIKTIETPVKKSGQAPSPFLPNKTKSSGEASELSPKSSGTGKDQASSADSRTIGNRSSETKNDSRISDSNSSNKTSQTTSNNRDEAQNTYSNNSISSRAQSSVGTSTASNTNQINMGSASSKPSSKTTEELERSLKMAEEVLKDAQEQAAASKKASEAEAAAKSASAKSSAPSVLVAPAVSSAAAISSTKKSETTSSTANILDDYLKNDSISSSQQSSSQHQLPDACASRTEIQNGCEIKRTCTYCDIERSKCNRWEYGDKKCSGSGGGGGNTNGSGSSAAAIKEAN